ncbi:hypothetical protein ACOJ84_003992 [Morganella morganii]|uniref:hypothetical protein n=2 Tax=Morganella morganii TaxID=582 RepID=UPI00055B2758|nr:hypothetical protein [Morganella morganii]ELB1013995.1 hypothetical protein [Morganella morganii]ELN8405947.1 hypothetical protein [Morganella morganii]MDS0906550.1 hypothetical protein [Morganella morganii]OPL25455.1 hypothetical protein B5S45_09775 [Morganella morganii]RTY17344.1 hypothetical protein EKS23_18060 [Morganella morganii subsp. morganii]
MSGHPHADLMAKAAEIAKTDKEWWRHFEIKTLHFDSWSEMCNEVFFDNDEYRLKPRFIDINGHQVPEPAREVPDNDDLLWIADITQPTAAQLMWTGHPSDIFMLERGILHSNREAAETHMFALTSFTQK